MDNRPTLGLRRQSLQMLSDSAVADEEVDNFRWSSYVLESGNHEDNVYPYAWLPRILTCSMSCPLSC